MEGRSVFRIEADPTASDLVHRLKACSPGVQRDFAAAVCAAALARVGVEHPALTRATAALRMHDQDAALLAEVRAVVQELDEVAWDAQDLAEAKKVEGLDAARETRDYELAFFRARAAGAVEQAFAEPLTAAMEAAYEAQHSGLTTDEMRRIFDAIERR
jgi:hypothetical protein